MEQPWHSLELPYGWEMKFDPGQKRYFFLDHINKTTTWEDPRIKVWNANQNSVKNKTVSALHEDPKEGSIMSKFPNVRKETVSLVLKSSNGDVEEACEMLKDMGYQEKRTALASDSLFKTLSLLTRPDPLSPKSSSSAPANPARPSSARSNSPVTSVRKTKTSYSETTSTISNSSEEDKKKNDRKPKTSHKHGQSKKKTEKEKKESHQGGDRHAPEAADVLQRTDSPQKGNGSSFADYHHFTLNKPLESDGENSSKEEQCRKKFASVSIGPNKNLARGPDPCLRSGRSPILQGHNSGLCCGPSPSNLCGPQKELLKGPQAYFLSADST